MSTYVYLVCEDHDPPLFAADESGQHLYDLPTIQADLADRDNLVALAERGDVDVGYFRNATLRFLRQHPKCRIAIEDEYGHRHPTRDIPPAAPRDRAPRNYAEQRALLDDSLRDLPPGSSASDD